MAKKKKRSLRNIPPCPDPEKYILVKTKEGHFWRRKRGTVTKAVLNDVFLRNAEANKVTMPAASRIRVKLEPFTRPFNIGRATVKISTALKKLFLVTGEIGFNALEGMDLQEEFPLEKIVRSDYVVKQEAGEIAITIQPGKGDVRPQNKLATGYYFELVLMYGDAGKEKGLQIRSIDSPLYSFSNKAKSVCKMELPLPASKKQWMLLLKISCVEGNEMGLHPKHYAMKVVKTGGG